MGITVFACVALIVLATMLHYEALRVVGALLPRLHMAPRARLIVVLLATFAAHTLEIGLYAAATYGLVNGLGIGALGASGAPDWATTLFFSAQTYTSLGYGDVVPQGALRALASVEALNGLLLIGWTASYTYIVMQRYWAGDTGQERGSAPR
jgi:hypothetical protein